MKTRVCMQTVAPQTLTVPQGRRAPPAAAQVRDVRAQRGQDAFVVRIAPCCYDAESSPARLQSVAAPPASRADSM